MRKLIQLMITVALLLGLLMSAAQADVGTLGISLVGRVSNGGEETVVPLTGVFRVLRDGEEIGVLSPGETMTLSGLNRVRLEPKPETFPAGWDLTAAFCEAPMDPGGTTIIQVALTPLTDESAGQRMNAGTTAEPENNSESGEDSQAVSSVMTPVATKMPDVIRVSAEPTAAPTPEPVLQPVSGGSATLTVKAFQDLNGNGYQGDYEGPISGMTAYLMTRDGAAVATGKAGDDGLVVFSGLPAGKYTVRAYLPEGWYFTRKGSPEDPTASWFDASALGEGEAAVSLAEGEARTIGVGLGKGLTVSGVCWVDATSDGIRKEGEPVLCGVRLTLDGQKNGLHFEAVSGEDGSWRFDRVRPGFYDFTAYVPDGMMFAKYSRTGGDARSYFTTEGVKKASRVLDLNDKESRTGINVGFSQSALITGICFLDANYNGFYDEGEQPLPGVKISAIKQVKDEEVAQVISGEDGSFQITGLRGNTYKIRALLPADGSSFTLAVDDASGNHFKGRDGRRENFWTDFVLRDAETRQVNVGAIYPASVTGTVYMDTDFSGTMGASEKIVTGFQVDILDEGGNLVASDRTSVKGRYELKSLTPGIYSLRVTAMKGYAFTRRGEENVILNLTGGAGYSEPFSLAIGETKSHMDIGMIQPGRVEGVVFADRNDNGLRDSGEDGLPGVQVRLLSEGEEVFRAEIGAEGSYLFDAVMPGEYTLEYTLPEGAIFAKAVSGGNTVSGDRTGVGKAFTLASGGAVTAPLCGALTLGEISGSAWQDSDGDGRRAEEEVPQAGLTVTLTPSRDDMEPMTVTTGEDGSFSLTGLRPDTWQLSVVCPEGKVLSRTEGVRLPLIPGENSQTVALEVPMGEVWRDQALGIVIPAALSGQAFLDENNNGLFDEGEATPAGLEVTVHDD